MSEAATLAGGCFWCTEAVFRRIKGVEKVTSGYAGGHVENPTYEQVCTGTTGHAESIQIEFDPAVIKYETLLEIFFATHDPTTLNQQGNDIGTQYRSAIFYHTAEQRKAAEEAKGKIKGAVTEITGYTNFYPAEVDHQQYYEINGNAPYCSIVISPKIHKLMERYGELVKEGYKE
jgi:peptide-methionine (S)-S-oxide reductase